MQTKTKGSEFAKLKNVKDILNESVELKNKNQPDVELKRTDAGYLHLPYITPLIFNILKDTYSSKKPFVCAYYGG